MSLVKDFETRKRFKIEVKKALPIGVYGQRKSSTENCTAMRKLLNFRLD